MVHSSEMRILLHLNVDSFLRMWYDEYVRAALGRSFFIGSAPAKKQKK